MRGEIDSKIIKRDKKFYPVMRDGIYNWAKVMVDTGELKIGSGKVVGWESIEEITDSILCNIEENYKRSLCEDKD